MYLYFYASKGFDSFFPSLAFCSCTCINMRACVRETRWAPVLFANNAVTLLCMLWELRSDAICKDNPPSLPAVKQVYTRCVMTKQNWGIGVIEFPILPGFLYPVMCVFTPSWGISSIASRSLRRDACCTVRIVHMNYCRCNVFSSSMQTDNAVLHCDKSLSGLGGGGGQFIFISFYRLDKTCCSFKRFFNI